MSLANKRAARSLLARIYFADWLYKTILIGATPDEGILQFSGVSDEIFNDKLFYNSALAEVFNICPSTFNDQMFDDKVIYLDKEALRSCKTLSDEGMKNSIKSGQLTLFSFMVKKTLAKNILFEEDVIPDTYTDIDGFNVNSNTSNMVPVSLIFSLDVDYLNNIFRLLTLDDTTITNEVILELEKDSKFDCFSNTLNLIKTLDSI